MNIELNGEVYINGNNLIYDSMDLSTLQNGIDYLVILGVIIAGLLLLDLVRRIMSAAMRVK